MVIYDAQHSQYITDLFAVEDEALKWVRQNSVQNGLPARSIQPEEGRFLQVLVRASGALKALEFGTLGGHSAIWIARGLSPGGKLITLEIDSGYAQLAQQHFEATGVADRVEIRLGDAHRALPQLSAEGPFDFVFIDGEKLDYDAYFGWALENTPIGGLIVAHNAFRRGTVLGTDREDPKTHAIFALNERVAAEPRVISTIYPAGDGMLLAVKTA